VIILRAKGLDIMIKGGRVVGSRQSVRRKNPVAFSDLDVADMRNSAYVNKRAVVRVMGRKRTVGVVSKVYFLSGGSPREDDDLVVFDRSRDAGFFRGFLFRHWHNMMFIPLLFMFPKPPSDYATEVEDEKPQRRYSSMLERMYPGIQVCEEVRGDSVVLWVEDSEIDEKYWILIRGREVSTNVCIENIGSFRWYEIPALVRLAHRKGELFIYRTTP